MARTDDSIRLSLMDRLIDEEPQRDREGRPRRMVSASELKRLLRRDLEWLLGTRRSADTAGASDERTVLEYGIADFSALSPSDHRVQRRIADEVRSAIEAHEPRLQNVEVTVAEHPTAPETVTVTVRATLVAETIREPVSFPFEIRVRG